LAQNRSQNQAFEGGCFSHFSRLLGSPDPRLFGALLPRPFIGFNGRNWAACLKCIPKRPRNPGIVTHNSCCNALPVPNSPHFANITFCRSSGARPAYPPESVVASVGSFGSILTPPGQRAWLCHNPSSPHKLRPGEKAKRPCR